jgi:hypothetical protein
VESSLLRQIRVLQGCVLLLLVFSTLLAINLFYPLLPVQHFKLIEAQKVNIREGDGVLKASLSNAAGFKTFGRAQQNVTFSGLMFYNEEGDEEGGLTYEGRKLPTGQRASASITFDQFRQDQNVYLHHDEYKDAKELTISDGLAINARPDFTIAKEEYEIYGRIDQLPSEQREDARLKASQQGKISTNRVFLGVKRGVKGDGPFDNSGVFIKNKWGRTAIKLYVDYENKPHFEIYDPLGKSMIYELKLPKS